MKYFNFPSSVFSRLRKIDNLVLLETSKPDPENYASYLFIEPLNILRAYCLRELEDFFQKVDSYIDQGYFLAGFLNYECGYFFEKFPALDTKFLGPDKAIAWLGVFEQEIVFNHKTGKFINLPEKFQTEPGELESGSIKNFKFEYDLPGYTKKIQKIKEYLSVGEIYQVNFTGPSSFEYDGEGFDLYRLLGMNQRTAFQAYIKTSEIEILSYSPELFFRREGEEIITKPMKGTAKRSFDRERDMKTLEWFKKDQKTGAENLMIVDLLRNDLGRISDAGSVKVSKLFSIEEYETLYQMTSTIRGRIKENTKYQEIFRALFPSGSVTGAPKKRAMELICSLENNPRGIYTGSIGFISPHNGAVFNVAIRTITFRKPFGKMGIGSGIVWDSEARSEYDECLLKAKFLRDYEVDFNLVETMLWNGSFSLLDLHVERLKKSSKFFNIPFDPKSILSHLKILEGKFNKGADYKVRMLVNNRGDLQTEHSIVEEEKSSFKISLSMDRVNSKNIFLFHKTTRRHFYNENLMRARKQGLFDTIFVNEKGEITEGSIHNIFIQMNGNLYTPPVKCGLLPGVKRQKILTDHPGAKEKVLYKQDLIDAEKIFLTNAVRGMKEVILEEIQKII